MVNLWTLGNASITEGEGLTVYLHLHIKLRIMLFESVPLKKMIIDGVALEFGEHRSVIREKIEGIYEEDDSDISLGENAEPTNRRRDVYVSIDGTGISFFLNYDSTDQLMEIEVHQCDKIKIFDVTFAFGDDFDAVSQQIMKYSANNRQSFGECIYYDLKMVINNSESMGGDGNNVSYFYCTSDVTHLLEE